MKKLLLSLAMVLGFVAMNAASVTIDPTAWADKWSQDGENFKATVEGYSLVLEKGTSTTDLVLPNEYSMRVYQGSILKITAPSGQVMKEITFTVDQNSKASSAEHVTYSTGWTLVGTPSTAKGSTFGATSEGLGSFELTAGKQVRIAKIVIADEAGENPGPGVDPNPGEDPVTPGEDGGVKIMPNQLTVMPGANTVGGYTVNCEKLPSATTPPAVNTKGELRLYAGNTMTVSGTKVTKVVVTLTSDAHFRYTTFTPSVGALNPAQAVGDTQIVWEGDAASVTFTVGDKATMGDDGAEKAGQIRIAYITVYGEGGQGGDTPVDPVDPSGAAFYEGLSANDNGWTVENVTLPEGITYVWKWDSSYNYYKASAFANKTNYAAEAIAVSPVIDLTEAATANLAFEQVGNFFTGDMTNMCSVLVKKEGGNWETLTISEWPAADGWKPWVASTADLAAYVGSKIQLGFKYTSTDAKAGTWEVKNVKVDGEKKSSSIADIAVDENAPVEYFNLQGVRVENPSNGIFIRRQGNTVTKVLVK